MTIGRIGAPLANHAMHLEQTITKAEAEDIAEEHWGNCEEEWDEEFDVVAENIDKTISKEEADEITKEYWDDEE